MCRVGQLSVSFASGAGGEECWCFRMPVHASMRGNYWQARLTISGSRVYLAPSSGCECENGCVACSHQVACSLPCVVARIVGLLPSFNPWLKRLLLTHLLAALFIGGICCSHSENVGAGGEHGRR